MDEPRPQNPDLKPRINVHRRTTKVNLAVVGGVIFFLVVTFIVVALYQRNPAEVRNEQNQKAESRP